ncbi:hypothetical protein FQA39_LY18880 [Lamprigera yunnana]|nr:hypothetical protein FQA39_LY18880 [Lamprigera yunnana]
MSEENLSGLQCDQPSVQPDIISQLGTRFYVILPEYFKGLLLFSGFDDLYSLSKIADNEIENFVRGDFFEIGTVEEVQKVPNEEETSKDSIAVNAEQKVQKIAEKYIKNLSKTCVSNELKDTLLKWSRDIHVEYRNESSVKIFCPTKSCWAIPTVTTGLTELSLKWILSNFNRHLKCKHFTESEKKPQKHLQTRIQSRGRSLYEIFHANMSNSFPSLATLYRQLDENPTIMNGTVGIETLKTYLLKRNLPVYIFVSEDQTDIVRRVQYNPKTNKMRGFAPPLSNKTGLPDITKFVVTCVQDIEAAFKNEQICWKLCLKMMELFVQEAKKNGITVEGFSTDGDPRCLKGMKLIHSYHQLLNQIIAILSNADKMNVRAIDKISSNEVIKLIHDMLESNATIQYLQITRNMIDAFLNKSSSITDRIYKIWYSTFFLRIWRSWPTMQNLSLRKNFVTLNTYTCIELNAHGLLLMIEKCRRSVNNNGIVKFPRKEEGRFGLSSFSGANTFPTTEYLLNLMKMAEFSAIVDAGNFVMLGNFINLQILMNVSEVTFLHEYSDTDDENTTQANSIELKFKTTYLFFHP